MEQKKQYNYKKKPNGKNDTGRKTKFTPETLAKLETAIKMGSSFTLACEHAGISLSALYSYFDNEPEFALRCRRWKIDPILKAQNNIMRVLNGKRSILEKRKDPETGEEMAEDPRNELNSRDVLELSKWYLERRDKDNYGTRTEITGADGAPIQATSGIAEMLELRAKIEQIGKMTDDDPDQ